MEGVPPEQMREAQFLFQASDETGGETALKTLKGVLHGDYDDS